MARSEFDDSMAVSASDGSAALAVSRGVKPRLVLSNWRLEQGFTLVEIMVVVTIIAILAGIGIPKMTAYIRTSEATEAIRYFETISQNVDSYTSIYPTSNLLVTNNSLGGAGNQITKVLPQVKLADDANFSYVLTFNDEADKANHYCIVATSDEGSYKIYFSKTNVGGTVEGWKDHVNDVHYVMEDATDLVLTGSDCEGL